MKPATRLVIGTFIAAGVLGIASRAVAAQDRVQRNFTVRIENISKGHVLKLSNGTDAPFALSPGLWLVHTSDVPVFKSGQKDRSKGLEAQAEDGNPAVLAKSLERQPGVVSVGVFNTPVGATGPGPAGPGSAFEFSFSAAPGARLTFATMFGQSNDLFYAPNDSGIALFGKNGRPIKGDITSKVILWDAGTEVNQEPSLGPDQAPRQKAPNTGPAESEPVAPVKDAFTYPKTKDVMRVTITPDK